MNTQKFCLFALGKTTYFRPKCHLVAPALSAQKKKAPCAIIMTTSKLIAENVHLQKWNESMRHLRKRETCMTL